MMLLHEAQDAHHMRHSAYGPARSLHAELDTFPRVPGHPEAKLYKWHFTDMPFRGGVPMGQATEYGICATPKEYLGTAQYTLIMDQRGVTAAGDDDCGYFYKDTGGVAVTDFPTNPEAEGWTAYRQWSQ